MSGGNRRMQLNTRERLVSQDHNRLQAFEAYDAAEVARRLQDMRLSFGGFAGPYGGGVLETGSYIDTATQDGTSPVGIPLKGDVIDGLIVLPQTGSLNLLVQPGVVWLDDPDGQAGSSDPATPSPDDSRYKLVVDPGITALGALVMSVGSGGSTRIDVIEVQRQTVIIETDNRDIFDPSTGLFTPVTVTKVFEGRLSYRVRLGTPGAGFPANVRGWLPLCVASVPAAAASVNDMTFWDVRPLVKDRVNAPADSQSAVNTYDNVQRVLALDKTITTTDTLVYGYSTAQIGMYRAGGLFEREALPFIDVEDVTNQSNGYAPIANTIWYLYALFIGNLPRWVRYNDGASTPRIPAGPNGVLAVSDIGPVGTDGGALFQTTIPAPLITGLAANGSAAVLLCAGFTASAATDLRGFIMQDGLMRSVEPHSVAATAPTATTDDFHFLANGHFPKSAKSVLAFFFCTITAAPGTIGEADISINILKPTTPTTLLAMLDLPVQHFVIPGGGTTTLGFAAEIPCIPEASLAGFTNDLEVTVVWAQTTGAKSAPGAFVLGWRL
jgi:hypothetical protein